MITTNILRGKARIPTVYEYHSGCRALQWIRVHVHSFLHSSLFLALCLCVRLRKCICVCVCVCTCLWLCLLALPWLHFCILFSMLLSFWHGFGCSFWLLLLYVMHIPYVHCHLYTHLKICQNLRNNEKRNTEKTTYSPQFHVFFCTIATHCLIDASRAGFPCNLH